MGFAWYIKVWAPAGPPEGQRSGISTAHAHGMGLWVHGLGVAHRKRRGPVCLASNEATSRPACHPKPGRGPAPTGPQARPGPRTGSTGAPAWRWRLASAPRCQLKRTSRDGPGVRQKVAACDRKAYIHCETAAPRGLDLVEQPTNQAPALSHSFMPLDLCPLMDYRLSLRQVEPVIEHIHYILSTYCLPSVPKPHKNRAMSVNETRRIVLLEGLIQQQFFSRPTS
jgi:hypothetical protein